MRSPGPLRACEPCTACHAQVGSGNNEPTAEILGITRKTRLMRNGINTSAVRHMERNPAVR